MSWFDTSVLLTGVCCDPDRNALVGASDIPADAAPVFFVGRDKRLSRRPILTPESSTATQPASPVNTPATSIPRGLSHRSTPTDSEMPRGAISAAERCNVSPCITRIRCTSTSRPSFVAKPSCDPSSSAEFRTRRSEISFTAARQSPELPRSATSANPASFDPTRESRAPSPRHARLNEPPGPNARMQPETRPDSGVERTVPRRSSARTTPEG